MPQSDRSAPGDRRSEHRPPQAGPRDRSGDRDPSALVWLLASVSIVLPWIGGALAVWGLVLLAARDAFGWLLVGAGLAAFVVDVAIDFIWAQPSVMTSDDPDLNRRANQLVGRTAIVEEAIVGGRGKVRLGDTLWLAEGDDAPAGATLRVRAARGTVLEVARPEDEST